MEVNMKIAAAITTNKGLGSTIDPRFGRAVQFLTVNLETGEQIVIQNSQNLQAAQGAGIQSAQNVITAGCDAVLTGHCGPKAFATLQAAGVKIYLAEGLTIGQAIDAISTGDLLPSAGADVEGHWG